MNMGEKTTRYAIPRLVTDPIVGDLLLTEQTLPGLRKAIRIGLSIQPRTERPCEPVGDPGDGE